MGSMASQSPASPLIIQPFIRAQIKENIKAPRHWPSCGEFTRNGEFPAQMASNAENVSIWWRHHAKHKSQFILAINTAYSILTREMCGSVSRISEKIDGTLIGIARFILRQVMGQQIPGSHKGIRDRHYFQLSYVNIKMADPSHTALRQRHNGGHFQTNLFQI